MRQNLIKPGGEFLRYEIREIVEVAKKIEPLIGAKMIWENIGDPVAKGEAIPEWMKDIVAEASREDASYAYAPTKGDLKARQFVLERFSDPRVCTTEDIIFFNGLGEAINKLFTNLPPNARIIGPNPTYPSHATAEAMHHGGDHITYSLLLDQGGRIDLEELENKVRYNESIAGILVINPNNPTGVVFDREDLKKVVAIAKKYDCFLIFDEIYQNLVFDPSNITRLVDIVEDVPAISMKGISKEVPWPGGRCGWIEVYNIDKDENFRSYIHSIVVSKMLEVCSTTLPQRVFPHILTDERFEPYFQSRLAKYLSRRDTALRIFAESSVLNIVSPDGVFYLVATIRTDVLKKFHSTTALTASARRYVDSLTVWSSLRTDKKFAYELIASAGICVVPLSGFNCSVDGFRMTLLEESDELFERTCRDIVRVGQECFT